MSDPDQSDDAARFITETEPNGTKLGGQNSVKSRKSRKSGLESDKVEDGSDLDENPPFVSNRKNERLTDSLLGF